MTSSQREYEEKRDYIRMFVDAQVEVFDPDSGQSFMGDSKNLSASGVAFVSDQQFDVGQKLSVKISSTQSKLPPLTADFIVSRCDITDNNLFKTAGSIENVN